MCIDDTWFYITLGGLAILLAVSETLGLSPTESNGIIDLIRVLITNRSTQ